MARPRKQDDLVKLMTEYPTDYGIRRKIALMSSSNVNTCVGREPLINYYLRTCKKPRTDILTAFANNGCDFNAQDDYGRTPLQLLLATLTSDNLEAFQFLLSHGADPCVVDTEGNNLLMMAIIERDDRAINCLIKDKTIARRLVTQKNPKGYDVLAMLLLGDRFQDELKVKQFVELGADVNSTDNNGDNCLHHLARRPVQQFPVKLFPPIGFCINRANLAKMSHRFKPSLKTLIGAGADIKHKNSSGLIPLQVALSCDTILYDTILDFKPLIPDEEVLEQLIPRPDIETMHNEPCNLSVQAWLVAQLVKYGNNNTFKDSLSLVQGTKFCSSPLVKHIIKERGVKPTAQDFKQPLSSGQWYLFEVYLKNMPPTEISDLERIAPDIVSKILSYSGFYRPRKEDLIERLVSNGMLFTVDDLKLAFKNECLKIVEQFIMKMDSSFEEQIKSELPDVLVQVLRLSLNNYRVKFNADKEDRPMFYAIMGRGLKTLVEHILTQFNISVNHVNSSDDSVIQCLMDMICDGWLAEIEGMDLFELVAKRDEFDAGQTVKHNQSLVRPIDMAMKYEKYDMAVKLIRTGASCLGINYDHLKRIHGATELLKLLYQLGVYVDVDEGDILYDWAQSQPVKVLKSLKELAAFEGRRSYSRKRRQNLLPKPLYDYISNLTMP